MIKTIRNFEDAISEMPDLFDRAMCYIDLSSAIEVLPVKINCYLLAAICFVNICDEITIPTNQMSYKTVNTANPISKTTTKSNQSIFLWTFCNFY